jgi:hypothetical protein
MSQRLDGKSFSGGGVSHLSALGSLNQQGRPTWDGFVAFTSKDHRFIKVIRCTMRTSRERYQHIEMHIPQPRRLETFVIVNLRKQMSRLKPVILP